MELPGDLLRAPQWVLETGTRHGGSALFFCDLLQLTGSPGRVLSIDIDPSANMVRAHPGIDFLLGDSASPDVLKRIRSILPIERGTLFVILDSDHAETHVLRELEALMPVLKKGDYLVVEDTCVNGHPVRPNDLVCYQCLKSDPTRRAWRILQCNIQQAHNAVVSSTSSFGGFGATLASGAIFLGRIRTFSPAAKQ